ncbi:MAG: response regulator [Planctomycetota bacterium]
MMRLVPVHVLVIDDDDAVCRKVGAWLSEAGYNVATFTDPAAGRAHAEKVASRVALLDLRLPGVEGAELIETFRDSFPRTRVLVLAAFPEPAELIAAVRAGARDVLEKPVQQATLLAALERQVVDLGIGVRSEEEFNQRLGARLRALRGAADRTLGDVADAGGLSSAQLSHIELGKTGTSTWSLARICGALGKPLAELLEDL